MKAGGAPTEAKSMFMSSGGTRYLMGNRAAENVTKGTRRQEPAYAAAWVGVPSCSGSSSGIPSTSTTTPTTSPSSERPTHTG